MSDRSDRAFQSQQAYEDIDSPEAKRIVVLAIAVQDSEDELETKTKQAEEAERKLKIAVEGLDRIRKTGAIFILNLRR